MKGESGGEEARAAFEQLFRDTRTDLLAYIVRRSPSVEEAADVLAETYLVAWQRLDAVPSGEQARLWLFGVAGNLLVKGASRRRSFALLVDRLARELRLAQPEHALDMDERSSALRASLAALPEAQREVVMLTAWEGLTERNRGGHGHTRQLRAGASAPGTETDETRPNRFGRCQLRSAGVRERNHRAHTG